MLQSVSSSSSNRAQTLLYQRHLEMAACHPVYLCWYPLYIYIYIIHATQYIGKTIRLSKQSPCHRHCTCRISVYSKFCKVVMLSQMWHWQISYYKVESIVVFNFDLDLDRAHSTAGELTEHTLKAVRCRKNERPKKCILKKEFLDQKEDADACKCGLPYTNTAVHVYT